MIFVSDFIVKLQIRKFIYSFRRSAEIQLSIQDLLIVVGRHEKPMNLA